MSFESFVLWIVQTQTPICLPLLSLSGKDIMCQGCWAWHSVPRSLQRARQPQPGTPRIGGFERQPSAHQWVLYTLGTRTRRWTNTWSPLTHASLFLLGRSLCSGWLQFRYSLRHVSKPLFVLGMGLIWIQAKCLRIRRYVRTLIRWGNI